MIKFGGTNGLHYTSKVAHAHLTYAHAHIQSQSANQREFQDPKMEVLYHVRPYVVVTFTYIGLI